MYKDKETSSIFSIIEVSHKTGSDGGTFYIQHCPHVDLVLVAKLSLLHPNNTGNYIVREESENVPMKLIEDSDECVHRTDDHRNV